MNYRYLKLSMLSLVFALGLFGGVSLFNTETASAQSLGGNGVLLPIVLNGTAVDSSGGPDPFDIDISDTVTAETLATVDQSQSGDELLALNSCRVARVVSAYRSTPRRTFISRINQVNGLAAYGYSLHYWDDYIVYWKCGSTYYKYRYYGEVNGGQVCHSFRSIYYPTTCQREVWDTWKSVSPGTPISVLEQMLTSKRG